jgi:radical SAM superfamily enzyme YgiQ (UPF0313 family)
MLASLARKDNMTSRLETCRALLVFPRFTPNSFWNYQETCRVVGARYSAAPLGLITLAALLPEWWSIRLVDRNIEELNDADLDWADVVMTGGMLPQQPDALEVCARARSHGKPTVVGGPDATCSPHVYEGIADYLVIGEAEEIIGDFLAAWGAGVPGGTFTAVQFPNLDSSPVPRFDLLKLGSYMHVGIQRSRGCPFHCEFCNVIELNGRVPRTKPTAKILDELDALRALGYRGHVDFVDDNFVGDRKAVRPFLRDLSEWSRQRRRPFEFTTEASLDLADDDELLDLMRNAGFFAIFTGIETSDTATLVHAGKKQNTRRSIPDSIDRFYRAGIYVNAGFIIGFDTEQERVAESMIGCIEASAIPVCMVGLLYAIPNTRLSRRLEAEGRLHADSDRVTGMDVADQCTSGLNYTTIRSRRDTLEDYQSVLARIYEPGAYFARVRRMGRRLDIGCHGARRSFRDARKDARTFVRVVKLAGLQGGRASWPFWRTLADTLLRNPRAARATFSMAALYLHLGPFARFMDTRLAGLIRSLD